MHGAEEAGSGDAIAIWGELGLSENCESMDRLCWWRRKARLREMESRRLGIEICTASRRLVVDKAPAMRMMSSSTSCTIPRRFSEVICDEHEP